MKTKFLSLLTVFAALTITACNGGNEKSESAKSTPKTQSTSKGPVWGSWTVVEPATCGKAGKEERTNDAGGKEDRAIPMLKQHTWTATDVDASGEGVAYEKIECSVCHAKGLRVATAKATINGTDKGGAPEGCIKLANANEYMEVAINLTAEEAKAGTAYITGAMDYWHDGSNENQNKTYSSVKTDTNPANFTLEINGTAVDMSETKNTTFGDMLPEEAGETITSGSKTVTYSQIGDCKVGAVTLQAGLNTFKFTRVDSYNLAVKYFTVVFAA